MKTSIIFAKLKEFKLSFIIIVLFTFSLYGNSLKNGYSMDDELVIENNARVAKGIMGIPHFFVSHYVENSEQSFEYRPIVLTSFAIEYEIFGAKPLVSHTINILIYIITTLLIFIVLTNLLTKYHHILPLLITVLFIAHPLHTEVVNNVKCRDSLLCFLFGILTMYSCIKYFDTNRIFFLLLGLICFLFSLMSKINAITFIALIPLTIFFFREKKWKHMAIIMSSFILPISVFIYLKKVLVTSKIARELLYIENPLFKSESLVERIPSSIYTIGYYLKLLFFPHQLSFYYGFNYVPIVDWSCLSVWLMLFLIALIIIYAILKLPQKQILSYGILFFLIAISPFTNFLRPAVGIIAERFVYAASLGFCIVLASLLIMLFKVPVEDNIKIRKLPLGFIITIIIIIGLFSFRTITRNPDWKDRLTLFRHDIKHMDNSAKGHSLLADTLFHSQFTASDNLVSESIKNEIVYHYNKSIEIYPEYVGSIRNLGVIYFVLCKDYPKALTFLHKAIEIEPDDKTYNNISTIYGKMGKMPEAIVAAEKSLELNGDNLMVYKRLFKFYMESKEYEKAIKLNKKGLMAFPDIKERLYVNIANAYNRKQDILKAIEHFELAFNIHSNKYRLCKHIAQLCDKIGNKEKAEYYYGKSIKLEK